MGKASHSDIQVALADFAEALGLDYSAYGENLNGGKIDKKFLPASYGSLEEEVTKETKKLRRRNIMSIYDYYNPSYRLADDPELEATLLGKVNALAEFLGVSFEVLPERVTATSVKAVKKSAPKKSIVTAKKGKK